MTTDRQISANRRNAKRSTGPKTMSGKSNSSSNALRHGLSTSVFADPVLAKEIEDLARNLADGCDTAGLESLAVDVAAAELDLRRIRLARGALIAQSYNKDGSTCMERLEQQLKKLCALDRYEKRAMSRRRSAIRRLLAARSLKMHVISASNSNFSALSV